MKINLSNYNPILYRKISQKFPDELIYSFRADAFDLSINRTSAVNIHRMFDTKTGQYVGEMITQPFKNISSSLIYPGETKTKALEIVRLLVFQRRKGYGTKFINFAKNESNEYNCNNHLFLLASSLYDPQYPSHIFYRKQGFTSINKKMNKILDKCIAKNEKLNNAENLIMYMPVKKEEPEQKYGFFKKLKNLLSKLI